MPAIKEESLHLSEYLRTDNSYTPVINCKVPEGLILVKENQLKKYAKLTITIYRPILYTLFLSIYGEQSWIPYLVTLILEMLLIFLEDKNTLSEKAKNR